MEEIIALKDIVWAISLILGVGSVYWKNEIDKVKLKSRIESLEHENGGQATKMETIITTINDIKQMLHEHLAYHKGKEGN